MYRYLLNNANFISIHAPRGGSDVPPYDQGGQKQNFNPRSPRGGATGFPRIRRWSFTVFQSTLPAGGATSHFPLVRKVHPYFNPRSPRGERPEQGRCKHQKHRNFNPRSPRGERHLKPRYRRKSRIFQSTLPAGGATPLRLHLQAIGRFQSTLPAGGATSKIRITTYRHQNFNPRSPRGERPTLVPIPLQATRISIHAPRGGSDPKNLVRMTRKRYFNPRSPRGERRTVSVPADSAGCNFNPRSPRGERQKGEICMNEFKLFQSTLPAGGATRSGSRIGDENC